MIKIEELIWDNWNIGHIGKHGVKVIEIEEACGQPIKAFRSYQNRLIILGKTKDSRLLTIILVKQDKGIYYVITARDISRKERRILNEK